jgi:hypothetical protein
MTSMLLSRSRRHGLRQDQARVVFHFEPDRVTIVSVLNGARHRLECRGPGSDVIALLRRLEALPVD